MIDTKTWELSDNLWSAPGNAADLRSMALRIESLTIAAFTRVTDTIVQ